MSVKRFVAKDMRRALDMVREQMGPEAIILSSQRTAEGVEIITSLEPDLASQGVAARDEFRHGFDEDFDSPLESDAAWRTHQQLERNGGYRPQTQARVKKNENGQSRAARSEQLAQEIERARSKLMATKGANAHKTAARPQQPEPAAEPQVSARQAAVAAAEQEAFDRAFAQARERAEHSYQAPAGTAAEADTGLNARSYSSATLDRQMAGLQEEMQTRLGLAASREPASDQRLNELQDQIADMRLLLEQQMWSMQEGQRAKPAATSLAAQTLSRHLERLGLPDSIVSRLASTAQPGKALSAAWRESLAQLARNIPTATADKISQGGVFALVGATGVGKTTTIAKLAARYVLEHGIGKVALITTDTYRVGAHDQLRSLGRILNVPVRVVDRERQLSTVVASLKDYPLVLIDTAGFRQGDPLLKEQEALLASCPGLQRVLVLSANSQKQTLKASAHAYGGGQVCGCVLTKLDETASLGEALGVVIEQKLPVLYMTDGQGIPNDIAPVSAHNLVAKAVKIMKSAESDTAESAVGAG